MPESEEPFVEPVHSAILTDRRLSAAAAIVLLQVRGHVLAGVSGIAR